MPDRRGPKPLLERCSLEALALVNLLAADTDIGTDGNGIDAAGTADDEPTMAEAYTSPISQALGVAQNESAQAFDARASSK